MVKQVNEQIPKHFEQLSYEDQKEYFELKKEISNINREFKRNLKECFNIILDKINKFINKNDKDCNKRMLVCGIAWLENGIGICMAQLSTLILRCKSTLNLGFKIIGYENVKTEPSHAAELMKIFPDQMKNSVESRKWTIRCKNENYNGIKHPNKKIICDNLQHDFFSYEFVDDFDYHFMNDYEKVTAEDDICCDNFLF